MSDQKTINEWTKRIKEKLVGRKIVDVKYMSKQDMDTLGWDDRAVLLVLDDGNVIWPSRDDEGNGAGALFTNDEDLPVIPVI